MRNDLDLRAVAKVRRLMRQVNYDIVHFHTKRAHKLALWVSRAKNRPKYVVTRRMDYPEPRSWYTHLLYNRRVDGVVAISRTIGDLLIHAGVDKEKIRLIHSGIDPANFTPKETRRRAANDATVVGCLAIFEERKGHRYLLEAAAALKTEGLAIQYKLAGDGPLRIQLENQVAHLGLADNVRFPGFITNSAEFLAGIDIFAMPSLHEGLGVAALEAMAAGKPVVATRVGGLTESVIDGVTGFSVPPRDSAALAAAIAKLARSPELAHSMGEQGRERVRRHFSLVDMADQNESYYYDLLGSSLGLH
jgi:glycosyltransferase involved in cell wall biosynthesis